MIWRKFPRVAYLQHGGSSAEAPSVLGPPVARMEFACPFRSADRGPDRAGIYENRFPRASAAASRRVVCWHPVGTCCKYILFEMKAPLLELEPVQIVSNQAGFCLRFRVQRLLQFLNTFRSC